MGKEQKYLVPIKTSLSEILLAKHYVFGCKADLFLEKERKYHRKSAFTNGVAVGFGIGCLATFAALLITVLHYSQATSEALENVMTNLSLPLTYFLILGTLFLIVGFVWERHEKQLKL
jgi:hypothetical protein